jgi:hypothetical protein
MNEIQASFNNELAGNSSKSEDGNSDKIIPININNLDNIHYNNKALFDERLSSICHAIVHKSVYSEFWRKTKSLSDNACCLLIQVIN